MIKKLTYTLAEISQEMGDDFFKQYVKYDGKYFTMIHPEINDICYSIKKELCQTDKQLRDWITHLLTKNWITRNHIFQLIGKFEISLEEES